MNDKTREALVTAALNNVRQIKGQMTDHAGGQCAMSVIHQALHGSEAYCYAEQYKTNCFDQLLRDAGLTQDEVNEIVHANNILGWDFLMIARKIGVPNEVN